MLFRLPLKEDSDGQEKWIIARLVVVEQKRRWSLPVERFE